MPNDILSDRDCIAEAMELRSYEITECAMQLRKVLCRIPAANVHGDLPAAALVLTNEELTYMICDFAEDAFAELNWD